MSLKRLDGRCLRVMILTVEYADRLSLIEIKEFLEGSRQVSFEMVGKRARYAFVQSVLDRHAYERLRRKDRSLVRRYLMKLTRLSRAQMVRLIATWKVHRKLEFKEPARRRFPTRYNKQDVTLLVAVDEAHGTLSGPATRRILRREFQEFGKDPFERLAGISVSHLYNLRKTVHYREKRFPVEHYPPGGQPVWGTSQAGAPGQARLPAGGHRASGPARRTARAVSHQRGGYRDAMGDSELLRRAPSVNWNRCSA